MTTRQWERPVCCSVVQVNGNVGIVKVQIRELARNPAEQAGLPVRILYARRQDCSWAAEQVTLFLTGKIVFDRLILQSLPERAQAFVGVSGVECDRKVLPKAPAAGIVAWHPDHKAISRMGVQVSNHPV